MHARRESRARRCADHLHAFALQEGEREGRAHRPRRSRRAGKEGRALSGRRSLVRPDARLREKARGGCGHHGEALSRLVGADGDHRGHEDLSALRQRVRERILVRGLRPAVSEARHLGHRQDAVPVPHQQGHRGLGQSINAHMPEEQRPIPFSNFIYFGDGDTDVPSMALLKKNGGHAIAVHDPGESEAKCVELFKAGRCDFYAGADYRKGSDLFKRTCLLLDRIIADIRVREEARGLGA